MLCATVAPRQKSVKLRQVCTRYRFTAKLLNVAPRSPPTATKVAAKTPIQGMDIAPSWA